MNGSKSARAPDVAIRDYFGEDWAERKRRGDAKVSRQATTWVRSLDPQGTLAVRVFLEEHEYAVVKLAAPFFVLARAQIGETTKAEEGWRYTTADEAIRAMRAWKFPEQPEPAGYSAKRG